MVSRRIQSQLEWPPFVTDFLAFLTAVRAAPAPSRIYSRTGRVSRTRAMPHAR